MLWPFGAVVTNLVESCLPINPLGTSSNATTFADRKSRFNCFFVVINGWTSPGFRDTLLER